MQNILVIYYNFHIRAKIIRFLCEPLWALSVTLPTACLPAEAGQAGLCNN
jgi:hypothetical protein